MMKTMMKKQECR